MATKLSNNNLRDEITTHLENYYFDSDIDEAVDCTEEILDLIIIPALKKKIKFCNEQLKDPSTIANIEEYAWYCLDSKKRAFEEVIAMLQVKK